MIISSIPQLIISMILFFVLFFGIGFLLNMILRTTWVMAFLYPIVVILIIDDVKVYDYVLSPIASFTALGQDFISLNYVDIIVLSCGMIGAIVSGIVIRLLRKKGYQMF